MKYVVVRMDGKNPVPTNPYYYRGIVPPEAEDQAPFLYETIEAAKEKAVEWTKASGKKYQTRPAELDENWQAREQARFDSGEYVTLPWHGQAWVKKNAPCVNHYAHVSKNDPTMIAFTENEEKGQLDKQTRMAPSKYLNQYYAKILTENTIREWCAQYRRQYGCDYELKFAFTADEIEHVYDVGPSSCMAGPSSERHGVKSVRAYAGHGLAVAYIERKGKVTARVLCWPEKKVYCHLVYGDYHLLTEVLKEEGYKAGSFKGAKMSRIEVGGNLVLPSVEIGSVDYVNKEKDHLVIR